MPRQSILSCYLITEGLSITCEVFTWTPFRDTHIKVWWASTWNCVVDWSRRLPTLTICKRSSLWCVDCPMLPWQPATRCWLFAGRNAWSQITFFVRLNPVKWSTLTSSKSENQSALKNFRFAFVLLNMKSQIGIGRIRLEFARLTWLSTCNQRDYWACK